ncbi:DUF4012 domain-containing protein [Patescibacteria group bacterium]
MDIFKNKKQENKKQEVPQSYDAKVYQLGRRFDTRDVPLYAKASDQSHERKKRSWSERQNVRSVNPRNSVVREKSPEDELRIMAENIRKKKQEIAKGNDRQGGMFENFYGFRRKAMNFGMVFMLSIFVFSSIFFIQKGFRIKERVLGISDEAYSSLDDAIDGLKSQNFAISSQKFEEASNTFSYASEEIDGLGAFFTDFSQYFPYLSQLASGKNLLEAGRNISAAGKHLSAIAEEVYQIKESGVNEYDNSVLALFEGVNDDLVSAREYVSKAEENLSKVKIDDVPEEKRGDVLAAKEKVKTMSVLLDNFLDNSDILVELFGGNGPRKYLFLFQNNNEMRATGGFIGSYGLLDVNNGQIRKFFIDGIFNPDGQLVDRIVPPAPIQKISVNWSLHDSNWFPDFPASARKAMSFYEKTGGPTVDGVITFTPVVMQRMLEITGPIYMEEYNLTINSGNFIEKIQYEVEVEYEDEKNPKKILADLAPVMLEKLINSKDLSTVLKTLDVFNALTKEKHVLVYSSNEELQGIVSELGWSGEILDNSLDYLSVINTNINGYKTDGVIDEKIEHTAEIRDDGSVINTVVVSRRHNGGSTDYVWWNKVNANYMRIYVPKGSQLLSVEGQTKEINESPVDYDSLGFERDDDIVSEESKIAVDENTTTKAYEDADKTVFANWVYVSPQEEVKVRYRYLLPFKVSPESVGAYSLLTQKQSGSKGSKFISNIKYPDSWSIEWKTSENMTPKEGSVVEFSGNLTNDRFLGIVFSEK